MAKEPGGADRPSPRSTSQTRRLFSNDKIKTLTKAQIQLYISSFFDRLGSNHDLLTAVSPRAINYNIEKSFNPDTDPTQRRLQIAKYFNELRNILPAILIVDGGINAVPHNIGQIEHATICDGFWQGWFPILRRIPLVIITAARDLEEADELSSIMSLLFNEMRNLASGHYLAGNCEQGETWVITLPHEPVDVGPLTDEEVPDDPKEKIWYAEVVLDVFFEDKLAVRQKLPTLTPGGAVVGEPDLKRALPPVINAPDTVSINSQVLVEVINFSDDYRIVLSNAEVATLSYNMVLTPRKFGKTKIQVWDTKEPRQDKRILAEKEIEVI